MKRVLRQELHVLGEHREQAAHEEMRDLARRVMLRRFERLRDLRRARGDLARDLGGAAGRVERVRVVSRSPQALADLVSRRSSR